jgi:hypothetical protein
MLASVETNAGANAPRGERRTGARQRMMLRTAKLRCGNGEYPCVIHDVSETGAKLRLFHAHPPDSHKFLELANGDLYALERRWTDGAFAGYRFSCRVEIDEFIHEKSHWRRRPVRLRITHPVLIAAAGEPGPAALVNLSQQGACIEATSQLPLRAPVRVAIPGSEPRLAHVCWRRNRRHGLVFQKALTLDHLAHLALQLQPYGAETAEAASSVDPASAISA